MKAVSFYFIYGKNILRVRNQTMTSPYQFYLYMNFFYATGKISYAGAEIVKK
jgi:hypothetical protein